MLDTVWYESYNTKRLPGIDVLKIYAIIMVVLTHCVEPLFLQSNFGDIWIYTAVPMFLIIGAFSYSRKYYKTIVNNSTDTSIKNAKHWFNRKNIKNYFVRISIPYLFFMLLEVIVLPLIGYTTVDMAFLNTVKGGMGPGGYYLVVYLQLFLLIPFINSLYRKNPILCGAICFAVQFLYDVILNYALIPINPSLFVDINKYISLRFLLMFFLGTVLFYEFDKIRFKHIFACIATGFLIAAATYYVGTTGVYAVDSFFGIIKSGCWCFGLVALVMTAFKQFKSTKLLELLGGSTLHILLFQQLYFCCVGTSRYKIYIDLPVSLIGGFCIYFLSSYVLKPLYKKFKCRLHMESVK